LGEALMESALRWFDEHEVKEKHVAVAVGNEKVFEFYMRFGFYPRTTVLLQVTER
jgi:ribosomal protein S18 acetylase RimI-like enzyme